MATFQSLIANYNIQMKEQSYSFNGNSLIKANPYKIFDYNGKNIIVVPNSGAWVIGSESILSILSNCKETIQISNLTKQIRNTDFDSIIEILYQSGIVNIEGHCCTDAIVLEEKAKSEEISPKLLVLKYTNRCNFRCNYCYAYKEDTFYDELKYEDLEKAVKLITDAFGNKLTVVFHGGEPLLRFKAIKHDAPSLLKKFPEIDFSIQTNASLVNDEIASFLKEYKVSIGISIDGTDNESNSLRCFPKGDPSQYYTLKGVECLIKHGNHPSASIVLTRKNKDKIINTIKDLFDLGIRNYIVLDYFPAGRGKGKKDELALSLEENLRLRKELLLYINDHNLSHTDKQNKITERKTTQLIKKLVYWRSMYMCSESPCGAGRRMLAVGADGNLFPCDEFITNDKEFIIDHVSNITDLKQALRDSESVKKCYAHRIENIAKCSKCIWRNICSFHCAGNSFYFKGALNQPSSLCEYFQKMIPLTMELLYEGRIDPKNIL